MPRSFRLGYHESCGCPGPLAFFFWSLDWKLRAAIAKHYRQAAKNGCRDVIWSNEGLYLLNSGTEYLKLVRLFAPYSEKILAVCCFRDVESYRKSYKVELEDNGQTLSCDKDSYRYLEKDSWLFDFERKTALLHATFDELLSFEYDPQDNVSRFLEIIGYPTHGTKDYRYNVTS